MRVADRSIILVQKIEEWRHRAFEWATADCCQFTADVAYALTGVDYRSRFPRYSSKEEAEEIIARYGGMVELISDVLGDPVPVAFARRGDVIAADFGAGIAAGVCTGVQSCTPGPRGLLFRPTLSAVAAWRV